MIRKTSPCTEVASDFVERWSPRAFTPVELTESHLRTLFEAARWAPSAFNSQPWRFIFSRHGDARWDLFLSLLIPFNADWAKNTSLLCFVVSETRMDASDGSYTELGTHSYDAGAAWMQIALQAMKLGYYAHGMSGIDRERVRKELNIPEKFSVDAAFAVGKIASPDILPEKLRKREAPSDRKSLEEICFVGEFGVSLETDELTAASD